MICPACGNENKEGNRFCGECGKSLAAPAGKDSKKSSKSLIGLGLGVGAVILLLAFIVLFIVGIAIVALLIYQAYFY